jgi:hypothetical protein
MKWPEHKIEDWATHLLDLDLPWLGRVLLERQGHPHVVDGLKGVPSGVV